MLLLLWVVHPAHVPRTCVRPSHVGLRHLLLRQQPSESIEYAEAHSSPEHLNQDILHHPEMYLVPAIWKIQKRQKDACLEAAATVGVPLQLAGDERSSSPGKYMHKQLWNGIGFANDDRWPSGHIRNPNFFLWVIGMCSWKKVRNINRTNLANVDMSFFHGSFHLNTNWGVSK